MADAKEGGNSPKNDTEEVLKELEAEGYEIEGRKKPEGEKPKEKPEEEKGKPEGEEKSKPEEKQPEKPAEEVLPDADEDEEDEESDSKPQRKAKMMPAWKHEVALKDIERKHKEEMETLKTSLTKGEEKDNAVAADDEAVKKIADKYQVEPDFIRDIVSIYGAKLPKDVEAKLAKLDELSQQHQEAVDEQTFSREFDKDVLPLLTAEYPDLSPKQLDKLKRRVHSIAFTEDYAKTPLSVIYKGLDEFRGVVKAPKTTAEHGKPGSEQVKDVLDVDFENVSEEDVSKMDEATFDKFLEYKRKRKSK